MKHRLFVYGELCKPAVLRRQLGRMPPVSPAVARGYRRRRNPRTGYFEALSGDADSLPGLLLRELEEDDLARLDVFESVEDGRYRRVEVEVEVVERPPRRVRAWMYVAGSEDA